MTVHGIYTTLTNAGLSVTLNPTGDGLLVSPSSAITPELATLVRTNKAALVTYLANQRDWSESASLSDSARILGMATQWYSLQPEPCWSAWTRHQDAMQAAWDAKDTVGYQRAVAAFEALYAAWAGSVWPAVDDRASRGLVLGVPAEQGALVGQGALA